MEEQSMSSIIEDILSKNIDGEFESSFSDRKSNLLNELERIRIKNRKLLVGLWLCKFIKGEATEKKPKHNKKKVIIENPKNSDKIHGFIILFLVLFLVILAIAFFAMRFIVKIKTVA